jgi:hypothetical protein
MIESSIGALELRVKTDLPDDGEVLPASERAVRAALERCVMLMEQRNPGRVVLVRRLPLRWRIDSTKLDDNSQIDTLADSMVQTIEGMAVKLPLASSRTSEDAVIFDEEPLWRASYLLATARRQTEWFHAVLKEEKDNSPLSAFFEPRHHATALATLMHLARENVLAEVLVTQDAAGVIRLAAALRCKPPGDDEPGDAQPSSLATTPETQDAAAVLSVIASSWPELTPSARAVALRVHAAELLKVDIAAPQAIALSEAVAAQLPAALPPSTGRHDKESVPEEAIVQPEPTSPQPTPQPGELSQPPASMLFDTRCGGLFYLLQRIQELDLAESLWKACLPEGLILTHAAEALLQESLPRDPAPSLLGGTASAPCPPIAPEQHAEIALATCTALAAALPRRGLAELLTVSLRLVSHPSGRLLTASVEGLPFAFFAWPAATPTALESGLQAILSAWPPNGALFASPALAGLDRRGRVRSHTQPAVPQLLIPSAKSAAQAALLALTIGAPCTLVAVRAQLTTPFTTATFVQRLLAHRAHIRLSYQRMDIDFPGDALDLTLRRAGLDRDPGWIPWLQRSVHFHYTGETREFAPPPTWSAGSSR